MLRCTHIICLYISNTLTHSRPLRATASNCPLTYTLAHPLIHTLILTPTLTHTHTHTHTLTLTHTHTHTPDNPCTQGHARPVSVGVRGWECECECEGERED